MNTPVAAAEETMTKKEFQNVQLAPVQSVGGLRLALNTFAELEKFSHFMALSNFMPKHLRGKQADCLAVLLQAQRWEMDPFAVAQKTYFVNEGMAYEAQLVNAIINSRAPLKGRLRFSWAGEGDDLKCTVSGTFDGEEEPHEFTAEMKTITTRNSPLWKQQPKQQLGYFASRAWARLYCPDVLMGVYTREEMDDVANHYGADNAINITPQAATIDSLEEGIKAEKAAQAKPQQVTDVPQAEPVTTHDPETGEITETAAASPAPAEPPAFDINAYNLNTQTGTKDAVKALTAYLEKSPQEDRGNIFLMNGGMDIVSRLGRQGIGSLRNKFTELGVIIPQEAA